MKRPLVARQVYGFLIHRDAADCLLLGVERVVDGVLRRDIVGGILRVDTLARGVVEAANKTRIQLPVVLRLEGTNVEQGREILKESGLNFIVAETMKDAAEKVVAAARS